MAWDAIDESPLCVTLERKVAIPGPHSEPAETSVFRARERSVGDEFTLFLGLNIGPDHTCVEVKNDNIRGVAHLGSVTDEREDDN